MVRSRAGEESGLPMTSQQNEVEETGDTVSSRPLMGRLLSYVGVRFGWSAVVELLQLVSSVLLILLLSRVFPPAVIGQLSAVQALAMNALSMANLGTHLMLLGRASRGDDLGRSWSRAISLGLTSTLAFMLLLFSLKGVVAPGVDPRIYYVLIVGNLVFYWISELAVFLAIGSGMMQRAAEIRGTLAAIRIGALLVFWLFFDHNLVNWAWLSTGAFGAGAVAAVIYVRRAYGIWPVLGSVDLAEAREGLPYAVSGGSESTVDQSDRWMLESFGHTFDAGLYSNCGRIVQFGYLPLRMLIRSFDADLFRAGADGLRATLAITRKMAPAGLFLGVMASIGLWICAPLVPILLNDSWADGIEVIRLLAILPAIRSVQYLLGNSLTAARLQWWRFGAIVVSLVVNVGLNLIYLPNGTWRTAAYTTFVSEILMVIILAVLVVFLARRPATQPA